ncbi:hypothetical protein Fot_37680 [Forsythia ovata]|uniref:Uncharacterized protein n=1 Tax=Forsythia ovata TaxID=205694 RepID=A0ABD1RZN5_9LAMI
MVVTSPDERENEDFPASFSIGTSVPLKFLLSGEVKGFCFKDQVCLYKYLSHAPDMMGALDAIEESRPCWNAFVDLVVAFADAFEDLVEALSSRALFASDDPYNGRRLTFMSRILPKVGSG